MFEEHIKLGEISEKLNEVGEFEFENGIRLGYRILGSEPSFRLDNLDIYTEEEAEEFFKKQETYQ